MTPHDEDGGSGRQGDLRRIENNPAWMRLVHSNKKQHDNAVSPPQRDDGTKR